MVVLIPLPTPHTTPTPHHLSNLSPNSDDRSSCVRQGTQLVVGLTPDIFVYNKGF